KGQSDDTKTPDMSEEEAIAAAKALNDQIMGIISAKKARQARRQMAAEAAAEEEMQQVEAAQIIQENLELMNAINAALTRSNGRLNRGQRLALNKQIIQLISNTTTAIEVQNQIEEESGFVRNNVRGLFNALIEYYTEMASYGYNNAPNVLAKMGSMLAGTAMITSAIVTAPRVGSPGGILMSLSSYLGTTTIVAGGLYCLTKSGIPVLDILETLGRNTRQCITNRFTSGCNIIKGKVQNMGAAIKGELQRMSAVSLSALGDVVSGGYADFTIDWDERSGNVSIQKDNGSVSSASSTQSSASEASNAIVAILDVPEEQQLASIEQGLVPGVINTQYEEPLSQLSQESYGSTGPISIGEYDELGTMDDYISGGRQRKSRRQVKSRKSRKGGKGRKVRMTKKGKKHHKTMKRYRSKMRR
ncbi:hypothetical protein EBU24_06665, partial [bacterium]|nr:hypothetical protein [bacterium]